MSINLKLTAVIAAVGALALTSFAGAGAPPDLSKLPPASDKKGLTFDKDIKPLFQASCVSCHGEQRPSGGLKLTTLEGVLAGGQGRGGPTKVIEPGASEKSALVISIARIDPRTAMPRPPRGRRGGTGQMGGNDTNAAAATNAPAAPAAAKNLTPEEVGLVRAWIDQGAK